MAVSDKSIGAVPPVRTTFQDSSTNLRLWETVDKD